MAKKHIWYFIADEEGRPVPRASVTIYLAGSSTPANIFATSSSTLPISNVPQLTTGDDGKFEFWIENDTENLYGYDNLQRFKLQWLGADIAEAEIDDVQFFDASLPVNVDDGNDTNKNRLVSNQLAYGWEQHRLNNTHLVHGIEECPDWANLNDDPVKNKLVSNKMMLEMYLVNEPKPSAMNAQLMMEDWVLDEPTGLYRFRIDHNLLSMYLTIDTWDYDTNKRVMLYDYSVVSLLSVILWAVFPFNCRCVIIAKRFDTDPTAPENIVIP